VVAVGADVVLGVFGTGLVVATGRGPGGEEATAPVVVLGDSVVELGTSSVVDVDSAGTSALVVDSAPEACTDRSGASVPACETTLTSSRTAAHAAAIAAPRPHRPPIPQG
jgi:hypothetical protein